MMTLLEVIIRVPVEAQYETVYRYAAEGGVDVERNIMNCHGNERSAIKKPLFFSGNEELKF